jgi:hypothetical protein
MPGSQTPATIDASYLLTLPRTGSGRLKARDFISQNWDINLIQAASKEEAIELAKQLIKLAGDGETEIRQVYEASDIFP